MLRPQDIPDYIPTPSDTWKNDHEKYIFSDEDIENMLEIFSQYYTSSDVLVSFALEWRWFQELLHYKQELQDESNILTEYEQQKAQKTQETLSDDDNLQNALLLLLLLSGLEGFRELLEKMSDISFYVYLQKHYHTDEYSPSHHRRYYANIQEMIEKLNTILTTYALQLKEYELGKIRLVGIE